MPAIALNPRLSGLSKSSTLAISEHSRDLQAQGRNVVRLGLGQSPFPVPEFLVQELQDFAHKKDYLPVEGLPELRSSAADYFGRTRGIHVRADNIVIGPGSKELMFLLQLVLQCELLLPAPSWVSYAPQATILGRPVTWIPTEQEDDRRLSPQALDRACRSSAHKSRLLVLNYPGNPSGTAYAVEQLEALAQVARKHKLIVLSDEIYSGLHFTGNYNTIATSYPEGTIISDGLSKWCGAGGWRLGTFAFTDALSHVQSALATVASETFSAVSAPVQYAAVAAFGESPDMNTYLDDCRRLIKALASWACVQLREAGARVPEPEGGFYLLPTFPKEHLPMKSGSELSRRLLDECGVAALPGCDFGLPDSELALRLALVDFDGARALSELRGGATLDEAFVLERCAPTTGGIQRLCQWIRNPHPG